LFVGLMHDTVVRFYQLDIKMASDVNQAECLTNLLTSLVLKSPIYNSVHSLFQLVHRNQHVRESMKVVSLLRKRETLASELQIDTRALGSSLLKRQGVEDPSD
jgi:hypothetical protein